VTRPAAGALATEVLPNLLREAHAKLGPPHPRSGPFTG
jgi:hypothetical protein